MADITISLLQKTNITARIQNLTYASNQYNFRFKITRVLTSEYKEVEIAGDSSTNTYQDYNFSLLLPNTNFNIEVWAEYPKDSDTWYYFNYSSNPVTTDNISKPGGEYLPTYSPIVIHQEVYKNGQHLYPVNSCTASSISCAMNIAEYRERGTSSNTYSLSYIYGNRTLQPELNSESAGQYIQETLLQLINDGTPQWDIIPDNTTKDFPDNRQYDDTVYENGAGSFFTDNESQWESKAHEQCIGLATSVRFYDCIAISNYIQNNGYALLPMFIPDNYGYWEFSKFPEPGYSANTYSAHALCLIGWKNVGGDDCWIAQNSWGTGFGDSGRFYIPMNWGMNSKYPLSLGDTFWSGDIWSFSNISTTIARPSNFNWISSVNSGNPFSITAHEWNLFTGHINAFKTYKNMSTSLLPRAYPGNTFTSAIFNNALLSLSGLSSYFGSGQTLPLTKDSGDTIFAQDFINIKNALNSIT